MADSPLRRQRSKKGDLDEADIGIAKYWVQPGRRFMRSAAIPAENITRVSTRRSAAVATADPMAIPTSVGQ